MIDPFKPNPKILILGVAYKAGVSDTRESPVSELQNVLESKGIEVAWHDPLVPSWRGTKSVELDWDCDLAILATKQPKVDIAFLLNRGIAILDCTNSYPSTTGITSI
jgi:UDP-N-acetyl-D-mannosaminuronate dehydrogenase